MATKVTKYLGANGALFDTEWDADRSFIRQQMLDAITDTGVMWRNQTADGVVDAILARFYVKLILQDQAA